MWTCSELGSWAFWPPKMAGCIGSCSLPRWSIFLHTRLQVCVCRSAPRTPVSEVEVPGPEVVENVELKRALEQSNAANQVG